MSHPRNLLRSYGLRPRKGMGQHFLVNQEVLAAIAQAAELTSDDIVVEVGPGLGALTAVLAQQAGHVLAVEIDRDLAGRLPETLQDDAHVLIVQEDVLKLDVERELMRLSAERGSSQPVPYKVVANLPYYITTPVLRYFFAQRQRPRLVVVTVQSEVARRITAVPPEMNFLAVLVQLYGRPEIVRKVPAGAFYPPPKVDSAVVRIVMHSALPLPDADVVPFLKLVSAGFSQPRKQVHNPLSQYLNMTRSQVIGALTAGGIDERRRPQTLSLQEWLALYTFLSGTRSSA